MSSLKYRISELEQSATLLDLKGMTDEELRAHSATLPMFSKGMYAAVLMLMGRYPSGFRVVNYDPEHGKL